MAGVLSGSYAAVRINMRDDAVTVYQSTQMGG